MAKAKSKKGLSDKVRMKQKVRSKQPPNPFEIKVNRSKHPVVNKNLQKWEKGQPGVSRSKALKKRKDTLLRELHHIKKSNSLLDKRFGENDSNLTADEKMIQRFAIEKKKQMKKSDFSLNEEEEVLTHYGQSLAENLKDTIGSDSDEEDSGKLSMGNLQFGGFLKESGEVSLKEKMMEVIADSKKQKFERQAEKEKTLETTKELDSSWRSLASHFKTPSKPTSDKKASNFMQLFHSLVMEQKSSAASDKLKTEEEKAKEEADRLQQLEAERLARMRGSLNKPTSKHKSADELDDGFALGPVKKTVSFAEPQADDDLADCKESAEESEQADETTQGSGASVDDDSDGDEEEDDDNDDEDEDSSDDYSDLDSEKENEDSDEETEELKLRKFNDTKQKKILKRSTTPESDDVQASSNLPFVFEAPNSYDSLKSLLHGHRAEEIATILMRLRKCCHPSLAEGNKEKLEKVQQYLLQYYGEVSRQDVPDRKLINYVTTNLWELTQMFPTSTAAELQHIIIEHNQRFTSSTGSKKGRASFPETDTLLYLALVDSLFPTSDFQHPVTTPAVHFIAQLLSECVVRNYTDVVSGLLLCSLAVKYVRLSKRFIPEVVTFLNGLLSLGADRQTGSELRSQNFLSRPSWRAVDLFVQEKCLEISSEWSLLEMLKMEQDSTHLNTFRCEVIDRCLDLVLDCAGLWEDMSCLALVLEPCVLPLAALPCHLYPRTVQEKIRKLLEIQEKLKSRKLKVMKQQSKKPVALKLFEPEFNEFWSGKRKKGGPNKEANERERLNHKYKREMKAAVRELKRDNEVLARHQLETTLQKDADRKRKTKDLMHSLASQEGDYKAIKRMKK